MKTREEILNEIRSYMQSGIPSKDTYMDFKIHEVLLDIRDLLTPPKVSHRTYFNFDHNTPQHCPECTTEEGNVYYEGECPKHKQV